MKRGYYVYEEDEEYGLAVVADTLREAKKIAFRSRDIGNEWLEISGRWIRDANVTGLKKGILYNLHEGLLRGFYSYIEGDCDDCGKDDMLELCSSKALCSDCAEKEWEKKKIRKNEKK